MRRLNAVHDASLLAWTALALARATGRHRAGPLDAAVVGIHLVAGTPAAWARLRQRRVDPVALLAPPAVAAAVATTVRARPGWAPIAPLAALIAMTAVERVRRPESRVCRGGDG